MDGRSANLRRGEGRFVLPTERAKQLLEWLHEDLHERCKGICDYIFVREVERGYGGFREV